MRLTFPRYPPATNLVAIWWWAVQLQKYQSMLDLTMGVKSHDPAVRKRGLQLFEYFSSTEEGKQIMQSAKKLKHKNDAEIMQMPGLLKNVGR